VIVAPQLIEDTLHKHLRKVKEFSWGGIQKSIHYCAPLALS